MRRAEGGRLSIAPGTHEDARARPVAEDSTILVRCRAFIGDAIMALPALEALRERYPSARIVFAANRAVASLLEDDPRIDEFVALAPIGQSPGAHLRCVSRYWSLLRRERPAAHIALDAGGNVLPQLIWLARVPRRLACMGREVTGRRWHRAPNWLLTDHLPTPEQMGLHRAHGFLKLVSLLDCDPKPRPARLQMTVSQRERGRSLLEATGAGSALTVAFHPGASWIDRKWPIERMVQAAQQLASEGVQPIALGGPADDLEVQRLIGQAGATHVPTPGVGDLAWALGAVDALVANDSGPMHIAAALGTAVVALFGPNDPAVVGPDPLQPRARVLYHPLECSPCPQMTLDADARCARPHGVWCMEQIRVDEVLKAVHGLLAESRAEP